VYAAAEKWGRATALSSPGDVTRDNARDAAEQLRKAAMLADSAQQDIRTAQQQAERIRAAFREADSRVTFRLGVLYSAMNQYLKSMAEDAEDLRVYHAKSEAAVEALLGLDGDEFEVQQNVAVSYLRKSEDRQKSIRRLAEQMHEALRNIDNAGR
jgi:ribonucleotide monophosphatase NagD (HAD superfamily)